MDQNNDLPLTEDELAHQRLMLVQDQANRYIPKGIERKILCPYCGRWNVRGRQLCCDILRKALICVLSGRRALEVAEAEERARQN